MSIFRRTRKEANLILFFTGLKFLVCLLSISHFGFQRDELLHLSLADHPSWGYTEVPPFVSAMAWLGVHIFGDSVFAVRLIPAAFGSMIIYLTGRMVLAMGGKRFAITVACLGVILSPAFMASDYLLQPVVFDQFFWVLIAFLLIQFVQTKKVSYLYWIGVASGFGMLNKYTLLLYLAGLLVGIGISGQRKLLFNRHLLASALLGAVIFLPNFAWQYLHHFPVVNHMNELHSTQLVHIVPLTFIVGQLLVHATGIFIWLPGLLYLFFSRVRSRLIFISFAYLLVMIVLVLLHGKDYYGFGAYPALFAAGGICWQRVTTRMVPALKYSILALIAAPSLLIAPVAIPILSFPATLGFFQFMSARLNFKGPMTWEDQKVHATTQDYGDMLGWDEIVWNVHRAYVGLSPEERKEVTIFAGNYGIAGAIDHLGKKYDLPKAVCLSSSYMLWAPDSIRYRVVIFVDGNVDKQNKRYRSITKVGEVTNLYAREKGTSVVVCRDPLVNVDSVYRQALFRLRSR